MKFKFLKPIHSFLIVTAGFVLLNASCSKVNDLYTQPEEDNSNQLIDSEIPANFSWSTTKTIDVKIAVNDQFDGKYFYKLELFDREPHAEGAVLLGAGAAKSGQDLVTKITIPAGLTYLYVQQTAPNGAKSYTMYEVTSAGIASSNVASAARMSAVNTNAVSLKASTTPTSTFNRTAEPAVPTNAAALTTPKTSGDWNFFNSNRILVIESGVNYTGEILLNNGISDMVVYVKGTWNVPNNSITIGNNNKIIVLSGGKIVANEITQNATGTFNNYGTAELNNLNMSQVATYENYGVLKVKESNHTFNGSLNNFGTLSFAKSFKMSGDSKQLVNEGIFTVGEELTLPTSLTFTNLGTTTVQKFVVSSSGVITNNGELQVNGSIDMPSNSRLTNTGLINLSVLTANSGSVITNNGKMTIADATLTNPTVNVNCFTTITNLKVNGVTFNVATGARLAITTLTSGGGVYNLNDGAILDVIETAKFNTQRNSINASTGAKSLARIKNLEFISDNNQGGPSLDYKGNLIVATVNHPVNPQNNPSYFPASSVGIVDYNTISVTFDSNVCGSAKFSDATVTPPVDQTPVAVELGTFSFAFEDNWPSKGDYDLNDFVVDIQITKYQNKDNKVEKVVLKNKIRSVGASKRLAAAVQLDNVLASEIKSVKYSKTDLVSKVLSLGSNGVEQGQNLAVVTIVDDAHAAFGGTTTAFISTQNGSATPVDTEITIEFNSPLASFTYDDLNPFIINFAQNTGGRNEVHLVGRKPTDKINKSLLTTEQGANGLLSANDPYKSKDNYPFALSFPVSFRYPLEGQEIIIPYPTFEAWVLSGGQTNQFWYTNFK